MVQIEGLPSRYTIESLLGEGGFGKVFRVRDSHRKETLALKVISQDKASVRASLMKEFKVLAELQHPNLIRVFDFGYLSQRLFYYTMEFLEGVNLNTFLAEKGNLPSLPSIMVQLLDALAYLHRNGIVHGDIKPENVMIVKHDGTFLAKLLDFGLTSSGRASKHITASGTPRFLAPEILISGARKNQQTDLYALGVSLMESIAGVNVRPSIEITESAIKLEAGKIGRVLAASKIKNPSTLATFISDLCMPDPLQRLDSAETALHMLETLSSGSGQDREIAFGRIFIDREDEVKAIYTFLNPHSALKKILLLRGPRGIGKKSIIQKAMQPLRLKRGLFIDLGLISHDNFSIAEIAQTMSSQLGSSDRAIFSEQTDSIIDRFRTFQTEHRIEKIELQALILFNRLLDGLHTASKEYPVALLIPDADRIGKDFCRFIDHIISSLETMDSNIKIILSVNTDTPLSNDVSRLLAKLESRNYAMSLDVSGFSDRMLRSYLREVFKEPLLSDAEIRSLNESARGIPLMIEILLRQLIAEKVFSIENGKWRFDRASFARKPVSFKSDNAFAAEFDMLNENEQALLELLALINKGESYESLMNLSDGLIQKPDIACAALIDKAILHCDPAGIINFAHPIYKAFAFNKISSEKATLYNSVIAEHLARRDSPDFPRIARHYIAAGNVEMGLRYGLVAADQLHSAYMPYDCLKLLTDLKSLMMLSGTRQQLHRVLTRLAPVEEQVGLLNDAINSYEALINGESSSEKRIGYMIRKAMLLDSATDARNATLLLRRALNYSLKHGNNKLTAEIYYHLGQRSLKRGIYYLSKVMNLASELDPNLYLMALASLCHRHKIAGHLDLARTYETSLLERLNEADDNAKKEILYRLSSVHLHGGDYKLHRHYLEMKMELERKQEDGQGLIDSLIALAGSFYIEGNYPALVDALNEAYSLATRYNQKVSAVIALSNLILAYRMLGNYAKSLNAARQVEIWFGDEEIGHIGSVAYIKPPQLYLLLGKEAHEDFTRSARSLFRVAAKANNSISLGHYNMCFSTYHHINLRYRQSMSFAEKAIALFTKAEDRDDIVLALIQKAIVLASLGKIDEAAKSAKKAVKIYDEIHCEYLKPFLMLGRGMIARLAGESDARALLAEGLRTSRKMGTREMTWQLQRELALYHNDRGEPHKAMEYYQDAIDTLKQITETLDDEELRTSYLEVPIRLRVFNEIKELRARSNSS